MKKISSFKVFSTMVKRDLVIQLRDKWEFIFRVAMLPFVLILVYGYILPKIGVLDASFPSQMFPGMVGMSMLLTGIHGTAVPLTMDFNNSREIEDRLQAPVKTSVVALAKMTVGFIESFIGGLIVLPISLIFMADQINVTITLANVLPLIGVLVLTAITSACLGLLVGTIVKPRQIAAMFPGFLMPVVFTGAIFFSWTSLSNVPVFQWLILINPLVHINEALRFFMTPQIVSLDIWYSLLGIVVLTVLMLFFGSRRFVSMSKNK